MHIFILECRNVETDLTTNVAAYEKQEDADYAMKICKLYDEKRGVTSNHWCIEELLLIE